MAKNVIFRPGVRTRRFRQFVKGVGSVLELAPNESFQKHVPDEESSLVRDSLRIRADGAKVYSELLSHYGLTDDYSMGSLNARLKATAHKIKKAAVRHRSGFVMVHFMEDGSVSNKYVVRDSATGKFVERSRSDRNSNKQTTYVGGAKRVRRGKGVVHKSDETVVVRPRTVK